MRIIFQNPCESAICGLGHAVVSGVQRCSSGRFAVTSSAYWGGCNRGSTESGAEFLTDRDLERDMTAMRIASVTATFRVLKCIKDLPCIAQTLPFKGAVTKLAGNTDENRSATSGSVPILLH